VRVLNQDEYIKAETAKHMVSCLKRILASGLLVVNSNASGTVVDELVTERSSE